MWRKENDVTDTGRKGVIVCGGIWRREGQRAVALGGEVAFDGLEQ
jgi:hypothetical protein